MALLRVPFFLLATLVIAVVNVDGTGDGTVTGGIADHKALEDVDTNASLLLDKLLFRVKRHESEVSSVEINSRERIVWMLSPNGNIAQPSRAERRDAPDLIRQASSLNTPIFTRTGAGTLARSKLLRIDLQGTFVRNNQRYANIQIQINQPRTRTQSTTIAHAEIPIGVDLTSGRFIRRALLLSLEYRGTIRMERVRFA